MSRPDTFPIFPGFLRFPPVSPVFPLQAIGTIFQIAIVMGLFTSYGNFDIILGPFLGHRQRQSTPTLSVYRGLVIVHADWELIGAWNPML